MSVCEFLHVSIMALAIAACSSCDRQGEKGGAPPTGQLPDTGYELLEPTMFEKPFVFKATGGGDGPLPALEKNLSAVANVTIHRLDAPPDGATGMTTPRGFDISLPLPLALAFQPSHDCPILDDAPLPPGLYQLVGTMEKSEDIGPAIAAALEKSFAVRIRRTRREQTVWVLSAEAGRSAALVPTTEDEGSTYSSRLSSRWDCHGYSMSDLTRGLTEDFLHWIVVDETGLTGRFDFELPVLRSDPATVVPGITQLGLQLKMEKRQIDVVVIENIGAPAGKP